MMHLSKVFTATLDAYKSGKYSIISNMGGSRSGKTYSILQLIYFIATGKQKNLMISVVSRSMAHLKRGCLRDWNDILESVGRAGLIDINLTDKMYIFKGNNRVEFFSCDDAGKLHGSQRDILFVNECNYLSEDKIRQLFIRTSGIKLLDYNPSSEFWIDRYRDRPDFIELHSTYLDNDFLSDEQRAEIENLKNNSRYWSVYGLGRSYEREGLCYPKVQYESDHVFTHPTYGIDFGFYDPTCCVKVEIEDQHIYVQQVFYGKGMSINDIKENMKKTVKKHSDLIIADCAEPQIIKELQREGWRIKPCRKWPNSVFEGIQLCNNYIIHCICPVTLDEFGNMTHVEGTAIRNEFGKYSYEQDADGNYLDVPEDRNNHCMDAFRYVVQYLRSDKPTGKYSYSFV